MSSRRQPHSSTHTGKAGRVARRQHDMGELATPQQLARLVLLVSYVSWFALIAAGIAAYEGEPIRVKSKDLPLHWFDLLFRHAGAALLFALWALRAAAAAAWPAAFPRGQGSTVGRAFVLYTVQAALRMIVYQLHVAGYIFTSKRWARDNLDHPPHVMSDHILLGAALMGGFACEAALGMLELRRVRGNSPAGVFVKSYAAAATVLAVLVSGECYFTARYFHPNHEILYAAVLGLVLFQAPLLLLSAAEARRRLS